MLEIDGSVERESLLKPEAMSGTVQH